MTQDICVVRLQSGDGEAYQQMLDLFSVAFEDPENYSAKQPSTRYREKILGNPLVVPLVAFIEDAMVGALVAYELPKFEQERSEMYIYDLAVLEAYRRRGVATALIRETCAIARRVGAWVVYVQADYVDEPAVAIYTKLGQREDVLHFDINPEQFDLQ
jgi:aminoglycoside 3-N-acetyltransferase I